jgi:hypothetical protein
VAEHRERPAPWPPLTPAPTPASAPPQRPTMPRNDIEDGNEHTPLLGRSSHETSSAKRGGMRNFLQVFQFFGGGIYAPDPSTYDPIEILLNSSDTEERDALTIKWRDNKLSELSFVGVVVRRSRTENDLHVTDHYSLRFSQASSHPRAAGLRFYQVAKYLHGRCARPGSAASFSRCSVSSPQPTRRSGCIASHRTATVSKSSATCCPKPTASAVTQ